MQFQASTDTALGIFLGGDADGFGKGFEEAAVVGEAALLKRFCDANAVA